MAKIPLIIGHRGTSARLPENTLESFRMAFEEHGADMIEFDVHTSRDGIPVIIHDARLERTTDARGYVWHRDLKDLKQLDAGWCFDPGQKNIFPCRGKGIQIPTLEEVFLHFKDRRLAIEIKEKFESLLHEVMRLVKKFKAEERCVVGSKYDVVSKTMRQNYPQTRRFLSQREIVISFFSHLKPSRAEKDAQAVASMPLRGCHLPFDAASFIHALHETETEGFFWTINDPEVMKALALKKADGIITDDPGFARKILTNGTGPKGA